MRQIVLDTETTGLVPEEGHRIIEIGCLEMVDRRLTGQYLHFYINPGRSIERDAVDIHGITESFLADKLSFNDIVDELIAFLKGAELIIHNAPFDVGFLNHELKLTGKPFKMIPDYCQILDTLVIARQKHPGQHNNLDALCRRYHVDNSNREYHGALLDAELLAQVYLLMTGGQTKLFEQQDPAVIMQSPQIRRLDIDRKPLRVIAANEEEKVVHQAFLELLKRRGVCLWTDAL
ncbi:DNA polymerase III subunit epsilon [Coxiella-like endosymbiont]|uniref:DNA polymerase III subunit epsilon n=1 Tax=Coxiella-like endosymbiont TaxID=1592897 RepID=UPI00272BCA47|nr:DNA polymerase III subunit epsilon [Coxiella-like endosymbiont]